MFEKNTRARSFYEAVGYRLEKAERNALCRSYYRNGGTLSEAAERGDRFGDEVIIAIDTGGFPRAVVAFLTASMCDLI